MNQATTNKSYSDDSVPEFFSGFESEMVQNIILSDPIA
jgi:hypothetical protein